MTLAVITGSGSGIGAATRARLEAEGVRVIGVDIRNAEVIADLSTPDGRRAGAREAVEGAGGSIDRMVLAAGIGGHTGESAKVVSLNYFGVVEFLDACQPALAKGSDPSVVVLCSNSAQMIPAVADWPAVAAMLEGDEARAREEIEKVGNGDLAYMASKNAIGRAVRRRAQAWGDAGIRLNAVAPGPVQTPLLQGGLDTPGTGDSIRALKVPVGRYGQPEEIAELIAYLLEPKAGFVHGSVFYIDGGTDAALRPDRY